MVPAPDFRSGGTILSLADLRPYAGPLSLVGPMLKNFYFPTVSYYPQIREDLDIGWVFDAAVEALGVEEGTRVPAGASGMCWTRRGSGTRSRMGVGREALRTYLKQLEEEYRIPLPLQCAVERYGEWEEIEPTGHPLSPRNGRSSNCTSSTDWRPTVTWAGTRSTGRRIFARFGPEVTAGFRPSAEEDVPESRAAADPHAGAFRSSGHPHRGCGPFGFQPPGLPVRTQGHVRWMSGRWGPGAGAGGGQLRCPGQPG